MTKIQVTYNKKTLIAALVWGITYIPCVFVLKHVEMNKALSVALAIIPIITFIIYIYTYIKSTAKMDEVKQRIQFEAVVIAFALTVLMLLVLFMLSMADISNFDWFGYADMVAYCFIFYIIGFFISKRKYAA